MVSFNLEFLLPELFLAIALSALLVYGVTMSTTVVKVEGSDDVYAPLVQRNIISLAALTLLVGAGMVAATDWPREAVLLCDGVRIYDGPGKRWGAHGDATSLYIYDPDQNVVELRCY